MSIQQNFPAISPSLSLNFARSKTLDPRITFTRTSTATRVNGQGLVEVVPANAPRFDHSYDPVSGTVKSLGLLIEEQRTNLLLRSEEFNDNYWSKINVTINPNTAVSPDGTQNADIYIPNQVSPDNFIGISRSGVSVASGSTYTISFFMKSGGYNNIVLFVDGIKSSGGARTGALYRINPTEAVSFSNSNLNAANVTTSHYIQKYPNDWYRAVLTFPVETSSMAINFRFTNNAVGYVNTTGDGTSGIYIWGAQVEPGAFPTSYIPTQGSTVTRTADSASITGTNFSDWYNQSEGTVYADTRMVGVQTGRYDRLWAITNSNLNLEGISVFVAGPAGTPSGYVSSITITNSATEQVSGTLVETALTTPQLKSAFAFKQNDCASSYNGQQRFVDNIVDLSTFTTPPDRLLIGQPQRFQGYSCMTVSQLTYYPRRLTNTQLQNLTR